MDGPGTITWEEFLKDAETFVRVSDAISDGWELRGEKSAPGQAYLYRRKKTFVSRDFLTDDTRVTSEDDDEPKDNKDIEDTERSCTSDPYEADADVERPLVTEHHVLWSMSYGVPVLYFNAWLSDFPGINTVSIEAVQRHVPRDVLTYSELSQAIHPILGTTCMQLHPCKSQELMRNTSNSKNKLVSWLSAVAPVALGLKISLDYCELTL